MDVDVHKTTGTHQNSGTLSGGRQHPSGAGGSNGSTGGYASGGSNAARPRFDVNVPQNGYRWWYIDATSDDGKHGLTIIGFVGSVFSPYYLRARKQSDINPENHCAMNVALYGTPRRWAMTERGNTHVTRTAHMFTVGPSSMEWVDDGLVININERCVPFPFPLRGTVRLKLSDVYNMPVMLDEAGKHFWHAVAPQAHVTVTFEKPEITWTGQAYHDMNWGNEPLERGFRQWSWQRAFTAQSTDVIYSGERRDGSQFSFGRVFSKGEVKERDVPRFYSLPKGKWGMAHSVASEVTPKLIAKLEDTPFYTRNHVEVVLDGKLQAAFHESLSLDRFTHPLTQLMLPFRMPRRG